MQYIIPNIPPIIVVKGDTSMFAITAAIPKAVSEMPRTNAINSLAFKINAPLFSRFYHKSYLDN